MVENFKEKNSEEIDRVKIANMIRLSKTGNILKSKNTLFYLAIILINIVMLVGAWLVESNVNGVATRVFEYSDYRYFYLVLMSVVIIAILRVMPDLLYLYKKTKMRLFFPVVCGNLIRGYYNTLTSKKEVTDSLYIESLKVSKVNDFTSKEITNSQRVASGIAKVIYASIIMIIGSIFTFAKINILLYILAIIGLLLSVCGVMLVLYFDKYKAKYLIAIANLCKFLYRLKLIKDYEKLYNNLVVKCVQFGSVLKNNKLYLVCQIICSILIRFVMHCLLFFVVCMFNVYNWELFIEILFKCVILDVLIEIMPVPRGMFVYELFFLGLFRSTFVGGYVLYAMVFYRVVSYFLIQIIFAIGYVFGLRKKLRVIDMNITKEINENN